jgi:hypothetical protein
MTFGRSDDLDTARRLILDAPALTSEDRAGLADTGVELASVGS